MAEPRDDEPQLPLPYDPNLAGQGLAWEGHEVVLSQCAYCRHWNRSDEYPGPYCDAFPGGVPPQFLRNQVDHRRPVDYDGGIQFAADGSASPGSLMRLYALLDRLPRPG